MTVAELIALLAYLPRENLVYIRVDNEMVLVTDAIPFFHSLYPFPTRTEVKGLATEQEKGWTNIVVLSGDLRS